MNNRHNFIQIIQYIIISRKCLSKKWYKMPLYIKKCVRILFLLMHFSFVRFGKYCLHYTEKMLYRDSVCQDGCQYKKRQH